MAIATLTVDLVAKLGNIERDIGKVGQIAAKQAQQIDAAFENTAGVIKSFAAGVAGALSAGAIVQFARAAVDALDALNDASDATGATVENLSALEEVARRNGGSIELVETALLRMNQALAGAKAGDDVTRTLEAMGLSVEELKKQDPADALQKIAVAFNRFERDGNLARATQELFGKSLKEVAPFLKDVAEKGELNSTVTAQQAAEAEKFNKQLFGMQTNLGNVARSVVADMLPALNSYLETLGKISQLGNQNIFRSANAEFNAKNVIPGGNLDEKLKNVQDMIKQADELEAKFPGGVIGTIVGIRGQSLRDAQAALQVLKDAEKSAKALQEFVGPPSDQAPKPKLKVTDAPKKVKEDPFAPGALFNENTILLGKQVEDELKALAKAQDEYVKSIEAIRGPLEAQASQLQEQVRNYGLTTAEIENNTAAQIEEAAVLAELNGAYPDQIDLLQRVAKARREIADASDQMRIKDALAQTDTGKLDAQRKEMEFFADAFARGAITAEQFGEIAKSKLSLVGEEAKKTDDFVKDLGLTFSSAFEDAIVNGEKFGDVLQGLEKDIIRILARKYVTEPLANTVSSTNWSGLFTSIIGAFSGVGAAANGAYFDGGIAKFAKGDIFSSPTFFKFAAGGALRNGIMGEAGPEAIMPLKRGPDGKLGVATSGSGGGTYYIDATGADPAAIQRLEQTIKALNGSIETRAVSAVANQRLRGGSFSKAMGR